MIACGGSQASSRTETRRRQMVNLCMDKSIHKFASLDAMKAAELRDWQKLLGLTPPLTFPLPPTR